jgi:hypothetical protein
MRGGAPPRPQKQIIRHDVARDGTTEEGEGGGSHNALF